ncbi:hypothetical protein ABPG74_022095 [Tetrahymena malaccensis]
MNEPVSKQVNYSAQQLEVKTPGKLLNSQGQLIEKGFARKPLKEINEEDIIPFLGLKQLSFLRYKKWDFFDIISDKFMLLIHIADLGYAGNVQVSLYYYEKNYIKTISDTVHNLSKLPALHKNSMNYEGNYKYSSDDVKLSIQQIANAEKGVHYVEYEIETPYFASKGRLVKKDQDDELVMLTPINQDASYFYYNTKSYGLRAEGELIVKEHNQSLKFNRSHSLAGRDIGRGVWNYNSFWFWAHAQGFIQDKTGNYVPFGIDLGNGFEHESTNTYEDCIILNGRLHKLHVVRRTLNEDNVEQVWILKTDQQNVPGSLNATFEPVLRVTKDENFLVIQAKFKQFYGNFKGSFVDENGVTVNFDKIYGFAELHRAKW